MIVLMKDNDFREDMHYQRIGNERFFDLVRRPVVYSDKAKAPLWIFGRMAETVEMDPATGNPRCVAGNMDTISALQLDYDSGVAIKDFERKFAKYNYVLYTTYSYGTSDVDRFRVILPLVQPMPVKYLSVHNIKEALSYTFNGVDSSCFDRAHWQHIPSVRSSDAKYYWHVNRGGERFCPPSFEQYEELYLKHEAEVQAYKEELERKRKAIADAKDDFLIVPPCTNFEGLLRYCQQRIDDTTEGSRDNTLFNLLMYLHDQGADASDALSLDVWEGFQNVLERKVDRIWFGK